MSVSNLTNTKWVIKSNPTLPSDYYAEFNVNITTNGSNFTLFVLDHDSDWTIHFSSPYTVGYSFNTSTWSNQAYRIIKITGGTDVANSTLISWLEANATQVQVDDLTNTKWCLPVDIETQDISVVAGQDFDINFTSLNTNFTKLRFGDFSLIVYKYLSYDTTEVWNYDDEWVPDEEYRLISITGGNDVSNPDLLVWLNNNATQVNVTDLTGTKWALNSSLNISDDILAGLNFISNETEFTQFYIHIVSHSDLSYDSITVYRDGSWTNEAYRTLEISSGTDIANPDLIAWLSQNATYQEPVPVKTFDLSTLQLSAGTHEVKVKARSQGYQDSQFSNSVNFVVINDYMVDIVYNVPAPSPNGHAEEYGTQYYSTDDGSTWVRMDDSSSIRATQIKFKTDIWNTGVHIIITFDGTDIIDTNTIGTITSNNYVLSANAAVNVYHHAPCFAENTKIKLANGEDKFIQDITYDDELLVWDFYEGKLAKAKPCWIKIEQTTDQYHRITLDNGIEMRLVGPKGHRLFSVDEQKMLYSNELVGQKVYTLKGIATVLSCETVNEPVKYYNLTTDKYIDCFADNVLTGSRLNNMYHISDMKYDSDIRLISEEEEAQRWAAREGLKKCE